jgi:hypothetical protein
VPTANPVAEERLKLALLIQSIVESVDDFYITPSEENETRALNHVKRLPTTLKEYGEICRHDGNGKSPTNGAAPIQEPDA